MKKIESRREEALTRWRAASEKRLACIARLEASMKKAYKARTGQEAGSFFAM